MVKNQILRNSYLAALAAIAFFLPLSEWLLTFFIMVLIVIWIVSRGYKRIPEIVSTRRSILIFCLFYFVYLTWMVNTSDLLSGLSELKIILPILIFPVVTGLSQPICKRELKIIISFFIAGVIISGSTGVILKIGPILEGNAEPHEMSLFVSHIRLSLMVVFSIFSSLYFFFKDGERRNPMNFFYLFSAAGLTLFLFYLLSLTGLIILFVAAAIVLINIVFKIKNLTLKFTIIASSVTIVLLLFLFIRNQVKEFYRSGNDYPFPLESLTARGNPYKHFIDRKDTENGNKVWVYLNEDEMRKEWNRRSRLPYDSSDYKGQQLRYTLIRYLTSAGLRKDSAGVSDLAQKDISFIETGVSNRLFTEGKLIKSKIYQVIWQIDYYRNGGNPSGHSVTQRLIYLATGWQIFLRNILFGTGTGDLPGEFMKQYETDKTPLSPQYRYTSHNQYLTFLISFGITGFILLAIALFVPVYMNKGTRLFLFNIFSVIIILSMVGEDTLRTHTGVSFFAYFYSLFIFGTEKGETG